MSFSLEQAQGASELPHSELPLPASFSSLTAPAFAMAAGNAAEGAPAERAPPQGNMLQLGLQVVGIVFLVSTMTSWGKAGSKAPPSTTGEAVGPEADGFGSPMESAAKLARATAAPTAPPAAGNPLASFFGMAFAPTVHPALQEFEAIRKRALEAVRRRVALAGAAASAWEGWLRDLRPTLTWIVANHVR